MIGQRMQYDDGVLARFDHLIEITNRPLAHRARQWSVLPHGVVVTDQKAAHQITGGQVVVTGDSDQRAAQTPSHMLHEARLAAASGTFQQHRQPTRVALLDNSDFIARGQIERFSLSRPLRKQLHRASCPQTGSRSGAALGASSSAAVSWKFGRWRKKS